jgi:membrane-associated protein
MTSYLDFGTQKGYPRTMFGEGLTDIIINGGLLIIAATVFIECAFIFGFFLPGDTLLFLAGFIAGQGTHNIFATISLILVAATLGNAVGYYFGYRAGPKLFTQEDGILFQKKHILQAQEFYERHGGMTLILARFVPVLRTFAPLVAGIGNMSFKRFMAFSTIGAAAWAIIIPIIGFWAYRALGHSIDIEKYVLPIVGAIMVLSIGGSAFHALREGRKKHHRVKASELARHQAEVESHLD